MKTLKPRAGLAKLKVLDLRGTVPADGDYAPLAGLPLEQVHLDLNPKVVAVLKSIASLESVNGRPAVGVLK